MNKIALLTMAYNAEKTLRRAIDSALSQDMGDFTYYLVDNGSKDGTRSIIEEYAEHDNRILPFYFPENYLWRAFDFFQSMAHETRGEYIAMLDSDDEYTPGAFGALADFADKNSLDFAAGGNSFIDALTGALNGTRHVEKDILILDKKNFRVVPIGAYHNIIRPVWGKLFRTELLSKIDFRPFYTIRYGADTAFCLAILQRSERFGVLAGIQYKYYQNPKSDSYNWDTKRIEADRLMDGITRAYVRDKCGSISPQNDEFIFFVYLYAINDTLNVLLRAQIPVTEKIRHVEDIFTHETTRKLFKLGYVPDDQADSIIRVPVINWLLSQKECRKQDGAGTAADILFAMYQRLPRLLSKEAMCFVILKMPEMLGCLLTKDYNQILGHLKVWLKRHGADDTRLTELEIGLHKALNKPNDEMLTLLTEIRKKRPQVSKKLNLDGKIREILADCGGTEKRI